MTLHLALCTRQFVLQLSDRLVTRGTEPFDIASNKNVVYVARNGIVTFGYTGLAYLEGIPTDTWIAEKLTGFETGALANDGFTFRMGGLPMWLDVGAAANLLVERLKPIYELTIRRGLPISVQVAGWQWPAKHIGRARPIGGEIVSDSGRAHDLAIHWSARDWHFAPGAVLLCSTPEYLSKEEKDYLLRHLQMMWPHPKHVVGPIVEAIRRKARLQPKIGLDCMCVFLPHPAHRRIEVMYIGASHHNLMIPKESGDVAKPRAAYSPWLIGPQAMIQPALVVGRFEQQLGDVSVLLIGTPQQESGGLQIFSTVLGQTRPSKPVP